MIMSGNANWMALGAGGLYGTNTIIGGGGGGIVQGRDALDSARMGQLVQTPDAQYPDGYLGSFNSRRSDRLLDKAGQLNRRSYTRGVHVGARVDPGDYLWPSEWKPDRGLKIQATTGARHTLAREPEPRLVEHGNPGRTTDSTGSADIRRVNQMSTMLPPWN